MYRIGEGEWRVRLVKPQVFLFSQLPQVSLYTLTHTDPHTKTWTLGWSLAAGGLDHAEAGCKGGALAVMVCLPG